MIISRVSSSQYHGRLALAYSDRQQEGKETEIPNRRDIWKANIFNKLWTHLATNTFYEPNYIEATNSWLTQMLASANKKMQP
eukprot:1138840-Pelagomonas_calceolata.AAC.7